MAPVNLRINHVTRRPHVQAESRDWFEYHVMAVTSEIELPYRYTPPIISVRQSTGVLQN